MWYFRLPLLVCLFASLCFEPFFVCMVSDDAGHGICLKFVALVAIVPLVALVVDVPLVVPLVVLVPVIPVVPSAVKPMVLFSQRLSRRL